MQEGAPLATRSESGIRSRASPPLTAGGDSSNSGSDGLRRASQFATIGLFVIGVTWCAFIAQPVLVPVLLAWVIATITLPVVVYLERLGIPRLGASILVTLALLFLFASLLLLLSTPLAYWLGRASEFGALVKLKLQSIGEPLALLKELQRSLSAVSVGEAPALTVEPQSTSLVTTIFSTLTPAVSQAILFIGALTFYLVYQKRLRNLLVGLVQARELRLKLLRQLTEIDESMSIYFGTFTLVNLALGAVTVLLTWAAGLPNPLLWGVLAGVFNYIPYVGPALVIATLSIVGLLTFSTLTQAAVAPLAFLAIVTVEGNFITPSLMGRRLELNPFAVFLSIAFCTWLWGPVGAFLAVPLLMAGTTMATGLAGDEKPDLPE
ncbi:MAG: AI-2E family transporter [Hyphomicrobiaceae bacterium]|nr:AI-2E family transporter [Hyphomicrobiaceae bacterium]